MLKFISFCILFSVFSICSAQLKSEYSRLTLTLVLKSPIKFSFVVGRAAHNFFCNDIVNRQIKKEFEASFTYLSLSHYFAHDSVALHGFSKMFEHNWKEETSHGQNFMSYVVKRGGVPCTPSFAVC
jgi:hypothetical protein